MFDTFQLVAEVLIQRSGKTVSTTSHPPHKFVRTPREAAKTCSTIVPSFVLVVKIGGITIRTPNTI